MRTVKPMERQVSDAAAAAPSPLVPKCVRRITSAVLLQGAREVIIVHGVHEYRLRLTAQGKLILTK